LLRDAEVLTTPERKPVAHPEEPLVAAIAQEARSKKGLQFDSLTPYSMSCTMMKLVETELVEDPDGNSVGIMSPVDDSMRRLPPPPPRG